MADHNYGNRHNRWNIFCTKGGRRRTTECITCIYNVCIRDVFTHLNLIDPIIINEQLWLEKNTEDSIKDGIIITAPATRIFFVLQAANVKPPKASLHAMDIMKLDGRICGEVLVKDYAVYQKWITSDTRKI